MIESAFSLYKLIILYMLEHSELPLTNAQISNFIIGGQYTSYMKLQEVFAESISSGLISVKPVGHTTYYSITDQGRQTNEFFHSELSGQIKKEIEDFLADKTHDVTDNSKVCASYKWTAESGYEVHCTVHEGSQKLLELNLTVPTEAAAKKLCENWQNKYTETYSSVMKLLL